MGKTITISVNSEYVILNKGYRDYKILDFMERIALSLSLDNFLYIISFSGNRERVVDRIQLMTKSKYDSFSIALYDFNKNSKIVVILSNKGRLFCINLRENYKFKCIREVKFKKTRLNTTLNCVWKLKDGSGYFVLHKRQNKGSTILVLTDKGLSNQATCKLILYGKEMGSILRS